MQTKGWLAVSRTAVTIALALAFTSAGHAATERVLYSFAGGSDGYQPEASLVFDQAGNLYGTTATGGNRTYCAYGCGTVFELTPNAGGGWTHTVIYTFIGGKDGRGPRAGLAIDISGNLYGTTVGGGHGNGVVFEMVRDSGGGWTQKVIHRFTDKEGISPQATVIFDATGNLYGTTCEGGPYAGGTVFELSPATNGQWTLKVLHAFNERESRGTCPVGGLTFDAAGNLYGATATGGRKFGTVFELTKNVGPGWKLTVLHRFAGGVDGWNPRGGVIIDGQGSLYGTTEAGGTSGKGTVFKLTPGSSGWTNTVLQNFKGSDGKFPYAGLLADKSGNLYGTTSSSANGLGAVFELTPTAAGGWIYNVIYRFHDQTNGSFPLAGLIFDAAGNLYGTTTYGGANNGGTVFEILP